MRGTMHGGGDTCESGMCCVKEKENCDLDNVALRRALNVPMLVVLNQKEKYLLELRREK